MAVELVENYVLGKWQKGKGEGKILHNAVTGEEIFRASSDGLDIQKIMEYGRDKGRSVLSKMTFQERGLMLKRLALHLLDKKEDFYKVSYLTGATRTDSWIDIEGGIGNLFTYASLRRQFPDEFYYVDGDMVPLSKEGTFIGHHIMTPKEGVAVHINAFNFPVWGMLEKIAVNLLAGVPAVVKPATLTCYLTEVVVKEIVKSQILPEGALQLICGSARDILDYVESGDIVTFTGSASTGLQLKSSERILEKAIPFNMEADSLNCSVLGEDVTVDMPEFDLFVKEVAREMTVKAGQKCTAIRRILVPENSLEAVSAALQKRLDRVVIGNPENKDVRMGALAGQSQRAEVLERIAELQSEQDYLYGKDQNFETLDADRDLGAFIEPVLFVNEKPFEKTKVHSVEVFGPVATIMPYRNTDDAIALANMGQGSLVSSIVTDSPEIAREYTLAAAPMHGRILVLNAECAQESTGHGSPMPLLTHGGPGRAGGGEEMGGKRGVMHYLQRTSIEGSPSMITAITQQYQPGARKIEGEQHPFRKHFEELQVGDTWVTAKHTVTRGDISNFANVSGDNFYAHVDATSLEGTIFDGIVAHGYYILSKAAGLFVEPRKGPVLLNYGLDSCRFTKPVYPGTTIGVYLTCEEKINQEKRSEDDVPKGIVKWRVEAYDDTDETIMVAHILTMVKKMEDK